MGGDATAIGIWDDYAAWLGTALSSAIWLLDPQAIIIGGGIASAGDTLFDPLRKRLASEAGVESGGAEEIPAEQPDE